jgi:hypothetical protein
MSEVEEDDALEFVTRLSVKKVEGFLTGGETADITAGPELTADVIGCPVIGDRGYASNEFRQYLRGNNEKSDIRACSHYGKRIPIQTQKSSEKVH